MDRKMPKRKRSGLSRKFSQNGLWWKSVQIEEIDDVYEDSISSQKMPVTQRQVAREISTHIMFCLTEKNLKMHQVLARERFTETKTSINFEVLRSQVAFPGICLYDDLEMAALLKDTKVNMSVEEVRELELDWDLYFDESYTGHIHLDDMSAMRRTFDDLQTRSCRGNGDDKTLAEQLGLSILFPSVFRKEKQLSLIERVSFTVFNTSPDENVLVSALQYTLITPPHKPVHLPTVHT